MAGYVVRRLSVALLTLIVSSFLVFTLVALSGDPLADLRTDSSPNKQQKIEHRIEVLHLDKSIPERYGIWASGAVTCVVPGQGCDLGKTVREQDVTVLVKQAAGATLRLVTTATILAIILGVAIGVVTALRQYSGFDYSITFMAFLFFSLPVFWVAVLLKQYLAIGVNDWYRVGTVTLPWAVGLSVLAGLTWGALLGGDSRRRWLTRIVAFVVSLGTLLYLSSIDWFVYPALGPALITLFGFAAAFGITFLVSGLKRRPVLYAGLLTAALGTGLQFVVIPWLENPKWSSWPNILLLLLIAIVVGLAVGAAVGGLDRAPAMRVGAFTAVAFGALMVLDILLRNLNGYSQLVNGRVIATIGSETPNFRGTFWQQQLDTVTHLLLPTLAIMLISFAAYSRYSRATMLEVMNQDYIRTARSKGLTERTVVMRHGFRNALIPITTIAALDLGAVIGGAVITEYVFGWQGMGSLFINGLKSTDPNPVMAFYLVTALSIALFNVLADVTYAYLDPRIRL